MADVPFLYAFAIGTQTARGTVNATVQGLSGALTSTDGILLGDPQSGDGESGISFKLIRDLREKAVISGSFTLPASDFIGRKVDGLSIAVPLKGNGATISGTPTDAEYTPLAGLDALLRSVGWAGGAWAGGLGWDYSPASTTPCTVKLWIGDDQSPDNSIAVVLMDVEGGWSIKSDPGDIGILTAALSGTWVSNAVVTTPTFSYGTQTSLSAPSVQSVGFNWSVTRDYVSMTVTGDNQSEDVARSNAASGKATRQTGREIKIATQVLLGDVNMVFELDELARTTASTTAMSWTVGTAAGIAATQNAWKLEALTPEVQSWQPDKSGADQVVTVDLSARSGTANAELSLLFI